MQIFLWRTWGSATAKESESGPLAVFLKKKIYSDKTFKDQRFVADNREGWLCVGNMLSFVNLKRRKMFNVASDGTLQPDAVPHVYVNL